MNAFIVAFIIMAAAALIGGLIFWGHRAGRKRREAFEHLAFELRCSFSPDGDATLFSKLEGYKLFSIGHSKRMTNILRGSMHGGKAAIFDYQYTIGGGQHSHTYRQTVLCFDLEGRALPAFSLRPERAWHRIGAVVGYEDIDFDRHPEFSKAYFLKGEDEYGVRRIFTDDVIAFFERERGLCMEGGAGYLLLYREQKRIKPEEIRSFLEKGTRILELVRGRR